VPDVECRQHRTESGKKPEKHCRGGRESCWQDYYLPSDDGFHVFDTPFGKIGIVVCFDRHYPESIRTETLMGADCVLVPTVNVKAEPMEMFEQEIRVQAFQNSVFIAMCNRVGIEGSMAFAGESIVVSPQGEVIKKTDDLEQLICADIDLPQARRIRSEKPYTSLRHTEFYM
jgi:predicted amidohydrolase